MDRDEQSESSMPLRVERVIWIDAPPSVVYRFLIEPDLLVQWMGRSATLEPRPGGMYVVDYNGTTIAVGEFIEVIENTRVSFSWGWREQGSAVPPGSSIVTISLSEERGGTRLRLVHDGLPVDEVASHGEGWDFFLPRLTDALVAVPR